MVERVGTSDVDEVVPCLTAAFWDYPETRHLLPAERNRRRVLPRYLRSDAADAAGFGTLFAARRDGRVVGAAAWVPPSGYPVGPRRQLREVRHLLPGLPWGLGALREARGGQAANREVHAARPPHWWLRVVGVEPSTQGSGIGGALVLAGVDLADRDGVGCFLFTATEANVGWYGAFGFEPVAEFHPTPRWPTTWALWREPSRGAGTVGPCDSSPVTTG